MLWITSSAFKSSPFDHFTPERMARSGVGRIWQDTRLFGTFSVLDNVTIASPNRAGESALLTLPLRRRVKKLEVETVQEAAVLVTKAKLSTY